MTSEKTALANVTNDAGFDMQRFEMALKIANVISRASLLPDHLRIDSKTKQPLPREDIEANCVLIVNQALRWGVDPFSIAPETYVVGGKLAYQGKLVAAVVNVRGNLRENLKYTYEGEGDDRTVTVTGHVNGEAEPRTVTVVYSKAVTRKDGKITDQWLKDPDQKLAYIGAVKWARKHVPQVMLGIIDEADDVEQPDYSSHDALMGRVYQASGPRLECDNSTPDTSDLPELPRLDHAAVVAQTIQQYMHAIGSCKTRDGINKIVEQIKQEPMDSLHPADAESLKDVARIKYKELPEPELTDGASSLVRQYRGMINDSQSIDGMVALLETINDDERLPIAERKKLSSFGNKRVETLKV